MRDDTRDPKRSRPLFDPTINYGHLLTVISFIAAGAAAFLGMKAELQNVDHRIAKIENTLQQLANVVVLTARQDEKINAMDRRISQLEQAAAFKRP